LAEKQYTVNPLFDNRCRTSNFNVGDTKNQTAYNKQLTLFKSTLARSLLNIKKLKLY